MTDAMFVEVLIAGNNSKIFPMHDGRLDSELILSPIYTPRFYVLAEMIFGVNISPWQKQINILCLCLLL